MRLPYVQVAMEVLEQAAPTLSVMLGKSELEILGGLVKLFGWAISRCPDDRPPSHSAIVPGVAAPLLIARAAGFDGDPELFLEACEAVSPDPLLERVTGGVRICGLSRYDAYWRKNKPAAAKLWDESRPGSALTSERTRAEVAPEPKRGHPELGAPDPDTDLKKRSGSSNAVPTTAPEALARCMQLRAERYPNAVPEGLHEIRTPWEQAFGEALKTRGMTAERFEAGFPVFLGDRYWSSQDPPCPIRAFAKHWRKFVPGQGETGGGGPKVRVLKLAREPGGAPA
jgi:hypothetical protein